MGQERWVSFISSFGQQVSILRGRRGGCHSCLLSDNKYLFYGAGEVGVINVFFRTTSIYSTGQERWVSFISSFRQQVSILRGQERWVSFISSFGQQISILWGRRGGCHSSLLSDNNYLFYGGRRGGCHSFLLSDNKYLLYGAGEVGVIHFFFRTTSIYSTGQKRWVSFMSSFRQQVSILRGRRGGCHSSLLSDNNYLFYGAGEVGVIHVFFQTTSIYSTGQERWLG